MSKYLVTGGAGFIGSHMCDKLTSLGHEVVCFDNLSTGKNIREKFIKGDVNNINDLRPVFEQNNFDGVFHYAATVGVKRTIENPLMVLEDVKGIMNILELSLKHGKPKVVFASSSEIYGEPKEIPEREDGEIDPKMPYSVVKLIGEKFLEAYYKEHGLKTCSLRFFNVYGSRQENGGYGFVVGMFIKNVLNGLPPIVFGDGSQTRDFVYIDDNIEATWLAMQSDKANGEVINIGVGQPITILELANKIISLTGVDIRPEFKENTRMDVIHRCPKVDKMIELLNFKPKVSLEEGLKKTIDLQASTNQDI